MQLTPDALERTQLPVIVGEEQSTHGARRTRRTEGERAGDRRRNSTDRTDRRRAATHRDTLADRRGRSKTAHALTLVNAGGVQ